MWCQRISGAKRVFADVTALFGFGVYPLANEGTHPSKKTNAVTEDWIRRRNIKMVLSMTASARRCNIGYNSDANWASASRQDDPLMVIPSSLVTTLPYRELRIDDKLHFVEEPMEVIDREVKQLKRSRIPIIKVRWNSKRGPEFTGNGGTFKQNYPHLFTKTAPSSSAAS
ncbi:hypothetical protein Tco_0386014 [Tanacetum coccineum]